MYTEHDIQSSALTLNCTHSNSLLGHALSPFVSEGLAMTTTTYQRWRTRRRASSLSTVTAQTTLSMTCVSVYTFFTRVSRPGKSVGRLAIFKPIACIGCNSDRDRLPWVSIHHSPVADRSTSISKHGHANGAMNLQ